VTDSDDLAHGWSDLTELTGGIAPDQIAALKDIRELEQVYPLLHSLTGRSIRDFLVRAAALEAIIGSKTAAFSAMDLDEALYWLETAARESTLRALRQNGWLEFEPGVGTTVTAPGRWVYDVLSFLHKHLRESELLPTLAGINYALDIGHDPIRLLQSMRSRLVSQRDEIETARASYSEVLLRKAITKLDASLDLSAQIRAVLDRIPLDQRAARAVVRDIHDLLSQLHGNSSELHQAVVELGRQYLQLSAGLTVEQIISALQRLTAEELGSVGKDALLRVIAAPPLLTTEVVAHAAETHIARERYAPEPVHWEEPEVATATMDRVATPMEVTALLIELGEVASRGTPERLAAVIPREDSATSFLRASLLALVGQGLTGEGIAGQLGAMDLTVETRDDGWPEELTDGPVAGVSAVTPGVLHG
jgi:hypothetical protein